MTIVEPPTLLVGLSAWRLTHAKTSPGSHKAPDDCFWLPTPDCKFSVSVATRLDAPDTAFADVPVVAGSAVPGISLDPLFAPQSVAEVPFSGTPPILIRIKAEPTAQITIKGAKGIEQRPDPIQTVGFFEGTGFFVYEGQGVWKRHSRSPEEDELLSADLFAPPTSMAGTVVTPFVFTLIPFFLSRVRDRTRQALAVQQKKEPGRQAWVDPSADFDHLDTPPVGGGKVRTVRTKVDLDNDSRVLEVKGFKTAALVGVCWPRKNDVEPTTGVAPFLRAAPMETLLFFHASFGQNAAIYNSTPYPFGLKQIDHGLSSYLNPSKHPLRNVYPLGIPYQIAVAGKQTVTVLPLNRVGFPELTNLNDGEQAAELFEEIHAAFLRFQGRYFTAPNLGRMALASFSAGIQEMMLFHRAANASPLLKALIEEVYIFEPIHSNAAQVANYAAAFKSWAGNTAARRVRVYSNESGPGLSQFVGAPLPSTPFVADSADGRFTSGVVTDADWLKAAAGRDHFIFTFRKPRPFRLILTKPAPLGSSSIDVQSVGPVKVGDLAMVGAGELRRVVAVGAKQVTFDRALPFAMVKDDGVTVIDRTEAKTTLTDAIAPGDRFITVADSAGFFEDAVALIDRRVVISVDDVNGNLVAIRGAPLNTPFSKGTTVDVVDGSIRTALTADHPIGSATLQVVGTGNGFAVGQTIGIDTDSELVKIAAIGPTSLTLTAPTTKAHRRGDLVGSLEPRVLFWGLYHAMFVSVMLTDAMRKSGFR